MISTFKKHTSPWITPEIQIGIVNYYKEGNSVEDVTNKYGCSRSSVATILKKNGVKLQRHKAKKRELVSVKGIIDLHNNGFTPYEIQRQIKCSPLTVYNILQRNGIQYNRRRNRAVNEEYFKNIDTHDKAYFLGFLFADGSVHKNKRNLIFCLKSNDGYIIQELKNRLNPNSVIYKRNKGTNFEQDALQINSKTLCGYLINHGCVPGKTKEMHLPNIDNIFFGSFLRGFFDGDGCISFYKTSANPKAKSVVFSSCATFNLELKEKLERDYGINGSYCGAIKNNAGTRISYHAQAAVLHLRDLMYEHDGVCLIRKKEKIFS